MRNTTIALLVCCFAYSNLLTQDFGQSPINRTLDSRRLNIAVYPTVTTRYIMLEEEPSFIDVGVGAMIALDYSMESDNLINAGYSYLFGVSFHSGGYSTDYLLYNNPSSGSGTITDVSYSSTRVSGGIMYAWQGAQAVVGFQGMLRLDYETIMNTVSGTYTDIGESPKSFSGEQEGSAYGVTAGIGVNKYYDLGGITLIPAIVVELTFGRDPGIVDASGTYVPKSGPVVPAISFVMAARF